MQDRRIAALSGNWCFEQFADRLSGPRAAVPQFWALPRTIRLFLSCSASLGARNRLQETEAVAAQSWVPSWLEPELSPLVGRSEWPSLLDRAPLDLRVNAARTSRDIVMAEVPGSEPTSLSPWGIRLPADSRIDDHPAYESGLIEVQDEGSQLIALACEPGTGEQILDLCAGAGGKALALAAAAPGAYILATDSNRSRLSKLPQRATRAGPAIDTRLLNPPHELTIFRTGSAEPMSS